MLYRERPSNVYQTYGVADVCLFNKHLDETGYRMMFQKIQESKFPIITARFSPSDQMPLNIPFQEFIVDPLYESSFLPFSYIDKYRIEPDKIKPKKINFLKKIIKTKKMIYGKLKVLSETNVKPNPNDNLWREIPFYVVDDNVTQFPVIGRNVMEYLVFVFWRNKICYGSIEPLKIEEENKILSEKTEESESNHNILSD